MDILNVLLIEDDITDAKVISQLLLSCWLPGYGRIRGADITHTSTLQAGLSALKQKNIDLVLLDLYLPDGNGPGMVERLRAEHDDIPVVVLTGVDSEEIMGVELVRRGAQDYLPKNMLDESTLARCIRYAIERHRLNFELQRQARKLKDTNEELARFMSLASHDLRSPLINVQGFAVELKRSLDTVQKLFEGKIAEFDLEDQEQLAHELGTQIPKSLAFIHSATAKMDRLTDAVLQLSLIGKRVLLFEEVDTMSLVRQCVDTVSHQIDRAGLNVVIDNMPKVNADRATLEHVFSNILDNAIKYTAPERKGKITISASANGAYTVFSVCDNGRGIAEQDWYKVFDVFRRAANTEGVPGEGVGLPLVRAIIKRHGGDIWFDSEPDKGSTFYFSIPKEPN